MADERGHRDAHVQVGSLIAPAPRVSICVLALGSVERLAHCLASLRAHVDPAVAETIVVANQMTPAQASGIGPHEDLVLLVSETNLGFGGGNNYAATYARGEYLVLLNDDSTVEPRWLENLLLTADGDPGIGAVAPRIISPDGTLQEAGSVLWRDGLATHIGEGLPARTTRYQFRRDVDYASANGLLVRRTGWDALGGFDGRYHPAYYEDVDLCLGLRSMGYRVVYEPRAVIGHDASQSTTNLFRRYLLERNRHLCVEKWSDEMAGLGALAGDKSLAVTRAMQRIRQNPPTVLIVLDRLGDDDVNDGAPPWRAAAELASNGWAVTVLLLEGQAEALTSTNDRDGGLDRTVDLGIECLFGSATEFWRENRAEFDAVALSEAARRTWQPSPDGPAVAPTVVPADGWPNLVALLGLPHRSPAIPAAKEATAPERPRPGSREVAGQSRDGEPLTSSDAARLEWSLQAAQAELTVKDSYIEKLEHDVTSLRADRARLPQTKAKRLLQQAMGRDRWSKLAEAAKGSTPDSAVSPAKVDEPPSRPARAGPAGERAEVRSGIPWLVVVGMHRSGTSALTGALGRMGFQVPPEDDWLDPDESNPDHFESRSMVLLDEKLLRSFGGSWDAPPALPEGWANSPAARAADADALAAIARAFPEDRPPAFKDPRSCICLPYWRRLVTAPMSAVFVWRSPMAVARSLERRNGFHPAIGLALWERYNLAALAALEGMDVFVTTYDALLADPGGACTDIGAWLDTIDAWRAVGTTWDVTDAASSLAAEHQHQRDDDASLLLDSQVKLLTLLQALGGPYRSFSAGTLPSPSPWASALLEAHYFENVATRAEREASGMRRSVSWRVTAPLRKASSRARPNQSH